MVTTDRQSPHVRSLLLLGLILIIVMMSDASSASLLPTELLTIATDASSTIPLSVSPPLITSVPKTKNRVYGIDGVFRHQLRDEGIGPEMILIPSGCVMLGVTAHALAPTSQTQKVPASPTKPLLTCMSEFALGRYEVSFDEYNRFAQATQRRLPDDAGLGRERNPVIDVNWTDAVAYSAWLAEQTGEAYRLPTETEWEYAARAGTDNAWPWGDEVVVNQAVCRGCGGEWDFHGTAPVGTFPPNPWGLYDLGGNVWEWTCSPFMARPLFLGLVSDVQPPRSEEGNQCADAGSASAWVMRGGSWFNLPEQLRTTYRTGQAAHYRYKTLGFRVAWVDTQAPITHLTLQITPPDAQVRLLNPERLGSADMTLPIGRYRLRIARPDFISFDQWMELTKPEQELHVDLKSINHLTASTPNARASESHQPQSPDQEEKLPQFTLRVQTDPSDAQVIILDPERPLSNQGGVPTMELPRGRYRVRAQSPGYESVEQTVELDTAGTTITFSLPWIEPTTGMLFIRIPSGDFTMGSPTNEPNHNADEMPVHTVHLETFLMGKYDVTFEQWDSCVAAHGCIYRPADQGWGRNQRPVVNVSWFDAVEFADWLSRKTDHKYRLPTETEWEYATRAGTTTTYWWGKNMERGKANCHGCGSQWDNTQTSPVGSFVANPWGLFDTTGNVWKWMCSVYTSSYDGSENRCVGKESKNLRGLRGGSWYNLPHWTRSANRYRDIPGNRNSYTGFRLIKID